MKQWTFHLQKRLIHSQKTQDSSLFRVTSTSIVSSRTHFQPPLDVGHPASESVIASKCAYLVSATFSIFSKLNISWSKSVPVDIYQNFWCFTNSLDLPSRYFLKFFEERDWKNSSFTIIYSESIVFDFLLSSKSFLHWFWTLTLCLPVIIVNPPPGAYNALSSFEMENRTALPKTNYYTFDKSATREQMNRTYNPL